MQGNVLRVMKRDAKMNWILFVWDTRSCVGVCLFHVDPACSRWRVSFPVHSLFISISMPSPSFILFTFPFLSLTLLPRSLPPHKQLHFCICYLSFLLIYVFRKCLLFAAFIFNVHSGIVLCNLIPFLFFSPNTVFLRCTHVAVVKSNLLLLIAA